MWKKCLEGQNGPSCYGSATQMPWDAAAQNAQLASNDGFAHKNGWRLPSIQELSGIVERQCQNPSINQNVFPGTPSQSFWTASQSGANAWSVDFGIGRTFQSLRMGGKFVRLVRDAQ